MILRRLGNKKKIAKEIQKYFPPHKIYIEPFFGAGGMFFNKPQSIYNFLNDSNDDVTNLFLVAKENKQELISVIQEMPISESLFEHWKCTKETNDIYKAARFLMLSNYSFMGGHSTLSLEVRTAKSNLLSNLMNFDISKDVKILNGDFRFVFEKISKTHLLENKDNVLIYSDPPYLDSDKKQNAVYNIETWTKKDVMDCFDITFNSGFNGSMSEFDSEFVLQEAKKRNLNVIYIGERQKLKNRRTEILITNYKLERTLFDCL